MIDWLALLVVALAVGTGEVAGITARTPRGDMLDGGIKAIASANATKNVI
jgi:hypothetical protein